MYKSLVPTMLWMWQQDFILGGHGCISCMLELRAPAHNVTDHLVQQDTLHYLPKTCIRFPEKDLDIEFPPGDAIVIQLKGVLPIDKISSCKLLPVDAYYLTDKKTCLDIPIWVFPKK